MSTLATIVGGLGELSESELRQLYLMVGVRLGIPDVPPGAKPRGRQSVQSAGNTKSSVGKSKLKIPFSKGNPKRKSQWANHPLYKEYSRLKKVVEAQSKEQKCSFNSVDTAESHAYRKAFSQWLEAKSSFRGRGDSDAKGQAKPDKGKKDEEESSEEEEDDEAPSTSKTQPLAVPPPTSRGRTGLSSSPPKPGSGTAGKAASPPSNGKSNRK
jgi:hypothetical protein